MTREQLWEIVDAVNAGAGPDMDAKTEALAERLQELDAPEVAGFQARFDELMVEAYTWDLWGAAYVIFGGCSYDGFIDFRSSLISMGRVTFEAALADPESLADLDEAQVACLGYELDYEGYAYACTDVYEEKTGEQPECTAPCPEQPAGEEWDEDEDILRERFPRLFAKYWAQYLFEDPPPRRQDPPPPWQQKRPWWRFW